MPSCQTADKPHTKPDKKPGKPSGAGDAQRGNAPHSSGPAGADPYTALHADFHWQVPEFFNIAEVCSRRWAEQAQSASQTAVIADGPERKPRAHSYAELQQAANRLSNGLRLLGVRAGERVAIALPQCF